MNIHAFNDFHGLLADIEGLPAVFEKQNLFLALSYLNRSEIPGGLEALAKRLEKTPDETAAEFQAYQLETDRQRRGAR